jgi:hypothetical protein
MTCHDHHITDEDSYRMTKIKSPAASVTPCSFSFKKMRKAGLYTHPIV